MMICYLIRKNPCVGCMKDYPRGSLGSNKEPLTVEEQSELLRFAQNSVIYEKYYVLLAFHELTEAQNREMDGEE